MPDGSTVVSAMATFTIGIRGSPNFHRPGHRDETTDFSLGERGKCCCFDAVTPCGTLRHAQISVYGIEHAMTDIDDHGRPEPPLAGDEIGTLVGFLEYQRATLGWKTFGLNSAGLQSTVGTSTMTLGGIVKHMAFVESNWFSQWLAGQERAAPWNAVDWQADPDWEWHSAANDSPDELHDLWHDAVAQSRSLLNEALAHGGLDQLARRTWPDGRAPSLRWTMVHMIEEYARHNGHADLLREAVDGETGE